MRAGGSYWFGLPCGAGWRPGDFLTGFCPGPAIGSVQEVCLVTEQWRPVVGYEDAYLVSDQLRVKSLARTVLRAGRIPYRVRERILRAAVHKRSGHRQVCLSREGRQRRHYVHRLAAEAFSDTHP